MASLLLRIGKEAFLLSRCSVALRDWPQERSIGSIVVEMK